MKTFINILFVFSLIISLRADPVQAQSSAGSSQSSNSSRSSRSSQSSSSTQISTTRTGNSNSSRNSNNREDRDDDKPGEKKSGLKDDFSRKIELNGETRKKEIVIEVGEKEKMLEIKIHMSITEGELFVNIYDPSGEKADGCHVDCTETKGRRNATKPESASCSISKSVSPPMPGKWIVSIDSKKARGTVKIKAD